MSFSLLLSLLLLLPLSLFSLISSMFTIAVLFLGFVCLVIRAGRVSAASKGFVVGCMFWCFWSRAPKEYGSVRPERPCLQALYGLGWFGGGVLKTVVASFAA